MKMDSLFLLTMTAIVGVAFASGCGRGGTSSTQAEKLPSAAQSEPVAAAEKKQNGRDHSGWWCNEHGVPEEVCGLCSSKVAAEFQKKGDWCKEHDRPDSQCFKCHPDLAAKFAAQYEAKFGKQPPTPEG